MAANSADVRRMAIAELARRELERREAAEPQPERRSFLAQLGRDAAYAGGKIVEGATSLVTVPLDAAGSLMLAGERALMGPTYERRMPNGETATVERARSPGLTAGVSESLESAGVPVQPESRADEVVGSIYRGVGGMAAGMGAGALMSRSASPVAAGIGQTLQANPAIQAASTVTGALGMEGAKEMGGGPIAQFIAGLAGAALPGGLSVIAQTATRGAFRGDNPQRITDTIRNFWSSGTFPTVGQAVQSRLTRSIESLLSRTPGGAGRMAATAEAQAEQVGARLEERARALIGRSATAEGPSAELAGRRIESSIRGEGGFMDRFKAMQTALYDRLDQFIPRGTRVDVSHTRSALEQLNAAIPGAPNVSRFFQNGRLQGIESALRDDTQGFSSVRANPEFAPLFEGVDVSPEDAALFGQVMADGRLPYEALKKLRTLVGNEISDSGLASDVPRSKWRTLYAALSEDLGEAVADNPNAQSAWNRANTHTRAGMRRIEAIESVLDRNGGPEAVFRAALAGTPEGATTIRAVMQSVDDEARRMITGAMLRRLGRAKPGAQDDTGSRFSTETFLTNWSALSPQAKAALFNRYGGRFRQDMDRIAAFASNLRQGSQVFRNPSGTAQAGAQSATIGAFAMAVATGHYAPAGAIAGGVAGANLSARLMTNERFVRWLAESTRMPLGVLPSQVNRLIDMARVEQDEDLAQFAVMLVEQLPQVLQQQPNNESDQGQREQQN